jgi:hypothetical protein
MVGLNHAVDHLRKIAASQLEVVEFSPAFGRVYS